jgi:hypothetical protein
MKVKMHWQAARSEVGPFCGRTPSWAPMTTVKSDVTCKWCLKAIETQIRDKVGGKG